MNEWVGVALIQIRSQFSSSTYEYVRRNVSSQAHEKRA